MRPVVKKGYSLSETSNFNFEEDWETENIRPLKYNFKREKQSRREDLFHAKLTIKTSRENVQAILNSIQKLGEKSPFYGLKAKDGELIYEIRFKEDLEGDINLFKSAFKLHSFKATFTVKKK